MPREQDVELTEDLIIAWAKGQKEIRAVIEIGSQARSDHPADDWSDIDFVVVIRYPVDSVTQHEWLVDIVSMFNDVWLYHDDRGETQHQDWIPFVTFVSGRQKVDIVLLIISSEISTDDSLLLIVENSPFPYVFTSGMRVLWDSHGYSSFPPLTKSGDYIVQLPSGNVFYEHIAAFWLYALQVGKLNARGELWCAEQTFYCQLRPELLKFIEWHSKLLPKTSNMIWPRGRFLEEWADPQFIDSIFTTKSANNPAGLWQILRNACILFETSANEIAIKFKYKYPIEQQERAIDWLQAMENPA
jgi:aminoglycoside 6-adenylyltransferase